MSPFSIEQMAELLIERMIRRNTFGLTNRMSADMLTNLTLLDVDEIEKRPFGYVDEFLDLHTSLYCASETTAMNDRVEAQCLEILSNRNMSSHKKISEYLDQHLKGIGREAEIKRLGSDIDRKSCVVAHHRVTANIILDPPRTEKMEFKIVLSRMIHPENGPIESINIFFPYSILYPDFESRLRFHTQQDQGGLGGYTDEDGPFIFRSYTATGRQLSVFEDLKEELFWKIIKDYKEGIFAGFWRKRDNEAYERMKARAQEKGHWDSIEEVEDEDKDFTVEEGRRLDELIAKEEAKLQRQEAKAKADSQT